MLSLNNARLTGRLNCSLEKYSYELRVIQQPLRARMCGFGEKDRRPCTPPPILQLLVYDQTGKPVDVEKIDTSFFTATCNLYSVDMENEMDLIRQRNEATMRRPSLPSTSMAPPLASRVSTNQSDADVISQPVIQDMAQLTVTSSVDTSSVDTTLDSSSLSTSTSSVKNLIGSSVTTGSKLTNMDGELGIFFVFPDLSIRKDGDYRFRFSFFDLRGDSGELLRTTAYIRTRTFSEPFRVYSAKQFPGMIESTRLSKHFAKQGVKIPVRKESNKVADDI